MREPRGVFPRLNVAQLVSFTPTFLNLYSYDDRLFVPISVTLKVTDSPATLRVTTDVKYNHSG